MYATFIYLLCIVVATGAQSIDFRYHNYAQLTTILRGLADRYPRRATLVEIGQSIQKRSLWAIALSARTPNQHVLLRPEVKLIANMHGNEVVGKEMLLHLAEYLLTSNDTQVKQLLDNSRVWLMPSMNPDGLEISRYGDCYSGDGRYNARGVDLNRNFPDYLGAQLESSTQEPETLAIIAWLKRIPFVLSANYHGGDFVINTPVDRYYVPLVSRSDDDDIYQRLARQYTNRTIPLSDNCYSNFANQGYVVRGADWYEIVGGMQDYGYFNHGTIEFTMEVSCCKYPPNNTLPSHWRYHRPAMIQLLLQAQRGVKGLILDDRKQPINQTQVMINNRKPVVNVTSSGEFWKILLPGRYTLKVLRFSRVIYSQNIVIKDELKPLNLTIIIKL